MFNDLDMRIDRNVPLGPMTWYKVGGKADHVVHPTSITQLADVLVRCKEARLPVYVLGSGANLLVRDRGVQGVVIQLDDPVFAQMKIEDNTVIAGAGYDLMKLVRESAKAGLAGLEVVAGIPASVGGAVRMNAGGVYGDIGGCIKSVKLMSDTGQVYERNREDLIFSYRNSNIVAPFILEATFELEPDDPDEVMRRVKEIFFYKKNTQPMGDNSAGCAFKNPVKQPGDAPPPSAGSLIDQAGLKGYRLGGAEVSPVHANFIVTHPGCKADDVLAVMEHVQDVVQQRFDIELKREVVVWP